MIIIKVKHLLCCLRVCPNESSVTVTYYLGPKFNRKTGFRRRNWYYCVTGTYIIKITTDCVYKIDGVLFVSN